MTSQFFNKICVNDNAKKKKPNNVLLMLAVSASKQLSKQGAGSCVIAVAPQCCGLHNTPYTKMYTCVYMNNYND